jgi:hypothetical protein
MSEIERTPEEIDQKIEELVKYSDYKRGPRGDNLKYKHQGWVDALRWVRGSDMGEEP